MARRKKWILIGIAGVIGVPLLAAAMFIAGLGMAASGTWPFEPLQHRSRQIALSNGAAIRIQGIEDRGWQSNGFLWTASFRDSDEAVFERIGGWIGPNDDFRVFPEGAFLVCLNPDRRTIHVRGATGHWNFFELRLPGKTENVAEFSKFFPALAESDLRRFQADLTEEEARYSPTTDIQTFDPATLEVRARILTAFTREAIFAVSEDGETVSLKSLRRIDR